MNESSLQPVISLNREIASLAAAGLPLDIGLRSGEDLNAKLERINASLAERVANGESIDQAIQNSADLPARYRTGLWAWIHHPDPTIALDSFALPAESRREFGGYVGRILFYPAILIGLSYVCLLVLCLFTAPALEALFETLFGTVAPIQWLQTAQRSSTAWGIAVPIVFVLMLILWRSLRSHSHWTWVPGAEEYYRSVRYASLSKQLAALIDSGRTTEDALTLLQGGIAQDRQPQALIDSFPPLLRWALSAELGSVSLSGVLHLVAESYQQSAERQREFWRLVMPTVVGAILGGVIVLAYGLALFLPIIELLYSVSNPAGVSR